jgi:hypothetical protein
MNPSSPLGNMNTATIDNMMRRLGIDVGCRVVPRYGLLFCCALRNCGSCAARAECSDWLKKDDGAAFGPPKFCANADLLSELLCEPAIGRRPHR